MSSGATAGSPVRPSKPGPPPMAAAVIDRLAAVPQTGAVTYEEPSAPNTPPTAIVELAGLQSSASISGPSHASMSSRSSSMALPFVADDGCSVFFARVPPTKQEKDILEGFQRYGPVQSVNLYRRWAASKSSKGCGIVTFEHPASADAAIAALHDKFCWKDAAAPMVVEKVDPAKLQRDTADRKIISSRLKPAASYSSDAQTSVSMGSSRDAAAAYGMPQQWQGPPWPIRPHHWQQQGPYWPGPPRELQKQGARASLDNKVQTQQKALTGDEQQQAASSPPVHPAAWACQGYPAAYPYYYGPGSSPVQYMMYPPGYCYPMSYPQMPAQCVWVPYMGQNPYAAVPSCPYTPAMASMAAAAAAAVPAAAGDHGQSSTSMNTGSRQDQRPVSSSSSSEIKREDRRQQLLHQQNTAQYPRFVDCGDQILNAKQLTTCIKSCASPDAVHFLVQQHISEMNHIHVSAALGRLAVLAASGFGPHSRGQHQQKLIAQLINHLVDKQLANAKPFELCNSLSAAAKLGYKAPADQVQQMLRLFVDRLGASKPNEVCTMLSAAARMGQRVTNEEFVLMLASVLDNLQEVSFKKVQELLRTADEVGYSITDEQVLRLKTAAEENNCSLVVANSMSNLTLSNSTNLDGRV